MLCVCVLLVCVASSQAAVLLENGLPVLWARTAGQLSDLPVENQVLTPDPWNYLHRLSLYRLLILATDPYMGPMGPNATDSPIWGLPLQLAWQLTSGRLADPTGGSGCGFQTGDPMCISAGSWWACVNYFVSVLPFLSAAQGGMMGEGLQVQMQTPTEAAEYCSTHTDCSSKYPDTMAKWDAFFQGLKAARESLLPDLERKDEILGLYWAAQQASFHSTTPCNTRKASYSPPEQDFATTWLSASEYVAAAHFQSNLEKSVLFLSPLPSRILQVGDVAPYIADLSQEENHSLHIFSWMETMNSLSFGTVIQTWQGAMCSITTRQKGRDLLEQLLLNPSFPVTTFVSLIGEMSSTC